jgi:ABC-type lipoprotein export system ATPase subunit
MLFQELRLFPELTSWENIQIKNKLTNHLSSKVIRGYFEMLGIADKIDAKVEFMSYGQRQRLAIIRALAQPFDFILLDEPISHLDDNNAAVVAQMIKTRLQESGAGLIVTSVGQTLPIDYDEKYEL